MPVNTAALKTFAPAMRRQLLEAVGRKLDLLLHSQTPDTLSTFAKQIEELRELEAENREQLLERVAYTWFNRLCALRYLDARGWHPFGCKVLMPEGEGETQPELLKLMRAGSLPAELKPLTNEARLHGLLDGQIPPAISGADPQGEVYRELVLASCRSYHQLLPELFEGLDDASELLLPDDLLSEASIAGGFRCAISDKDCEDVEIIGWLYQFYISEKKDQVIGKVVKSEDIPAATQLFTPNWIVKYMVQNSLGATWVATYPDSPLKGQMEFYIKPAEQTPEVQAQLSTITPECLDPEDLTLIDPACGSGHILVEAYDLLKAIYLERGYRQRDIPELILKKNLYGLDICPRAAQLAAFSLLMKGREDDRRLLERGIELNVMALQDSTGLNVEHLVASVDLSAAGVTQGDVRMLTELFARATTFGSLIQVPTFVVEKLPLLCNLTRLASQDLFASKILYQLEALVQQASILARRYDVVVGNPPYLGKKGMNSDLKAFLASAFPLGQSDLFSAFILRCLKWRKSDASSVSFVTPFNWMFLPSFQSFREALLDSYFLSSLVELEANAFEPAMVTVCTFVLRSLVSDQATGCYVRLSEFKGVRKQPQKVLEAIGNKECGWYFEKSQRGLKAIQGSPISYWIGDKSASLIEISKDLSSLFELRNGLQTSDNDRFLRLWHEVSLNRIGFKMQSRDEAFTSMKKWFPTNKGGTFRKWYGNQDFVVNWEKDGDEIRGFGTEDGGRPKSRAQNTSFYFMACISWSDVTVSLNSFRYFPEGFISNVTGPSAYGCDPSIRLAILAYANSNFVGKLTKALNPTLHFTVGDFGHIPLPEHLPDKALYEIAQKCLSWAKEDWNDYERSWNFDFSPLLSLVPTCRPSLSVAYYKWVERNKEVLAAMQEAEVQGNQALIVSTGLSSEIRSSVPIEQISLTINPAYRYSGNLTEEGKWSRFRSDTMAEFLSYATGCIMGRYSLDQPGLILANAGDTLENFYTKVGKSSDDLSFQPDPDGIIPVLDGEWFEDDIVARTREFLEVTFPESSVTENLRFIEESLGKDIRKYFCSDFYKDHLQTYKKRPIYWLVQSPKKGFSCLIYLHRYNKDTFNQVLNNYFRPYLQKLEARLAQLGLDQLNDDLSARERTAARKEAEKIAKVLKECQAWEQDALLPLAQQRIQLDLDDGVKVNYLKLQDVLAPIPGLAAKED